MLSGRAPESLLRTYHDEHYPAAANLIAFDKGWSTLMAPQRISWKVQKRWRSSLPDSSPNARTA
ncbi:hypothetical protein [Corynebacterium glutamicum]|uniref:hypothetical protein n=1 Tax=Corynebacterium glutamicum TaxID=1718 RepID=UPI000314B6A0|nr:hypothetical protein [Corynebacterium glutamicum]NII88889.1 hypothetical protein [Corynebacterium glutamicum]